jgi:hypothetical protein
MSTVTWLAAAGSAAADGPATGRGARDRGELAPALLLQVSEWLITTIVHSTQTLKPRCSAKTEKTRFLRAILLPRLSQNRSSSGSQ